MDTAVKADDLLGQRQRRIEKIEALKQKGIEAFPSIAHRTHTTKDVSDQFAQLENKEIIVAGRITAWRGHGKLAFLDLTDESGKVQLFLKEDTLQNWDLLSMLDVGDFIEATGIVTKTKSGEISIMTVTVRLLTKAIRPLPNTFTEKEEQFRRRYLDFVINSDKREIFRRKAKFWQECRTFMYKNGFMEVETPVLELVTGGADARPFVTHHNDLDQDLYLRISTELYQKRLIGGGFEKVFTLGPNFRNEGTDDEHLQEYYQLEWYWAYANYRDNMTLVRDLMRHVAKAVYGKTQFTTRGHTFDLMDEWREIDYTEIIKETYGIDIFTATNEQMLKILKEKGVVLPGAINKNRLIDNLWKLIRKGISGPAFLVHVPTFLSPLAKSKADKPEVTERFQIIIAGSELGNGYSELNNPFDQLDRFLEQQAARDAGDEESQMLDIDYVEMLEYGMPPTSGYGQSERVFWFLEDVSGREGTLFPLMRRETDEITKKIYPVLKK